MNDQIIFLVIGSIGAFLVLFAFVMNQTNRWTNEAITYDVLNALGSFLLVIYALSTMSIPFIIINIVWGGLSIKDIITRKR